MNISIDLVCFLMAVVFTRNTLRFLALARRVRGQLVGYKRERDDEGGWLYQPVFRFVGVDGNTLTATNPRNIWVVHQPPVGEEFDLIYNPSNPSQIWRDTWREIWFGPIVLWAVSLAALSTMMI
jgi:hypothetical protein